MFHYELGILAGCHGRVHPVQRPCGARCLGPRPMSQGASREPSYRSEDYLGAADPVGLPAYVFAMTAENRIGALGGAVLLLAYAPLFRPLVRPCPLFQDILPPLPENPIYQGLCNSASRPAPPKRPERGRKLERCPTLMSARFTSRASSRPEFTSLLSPSRDSRTLRISFDRLAPGDWLVGARA